MAVVKGSPEAMRAVALELPRFPSGANEVVTFDGTSEVPLLIAGLLPRMVPEVVIAARPARAYALPGVSVSVTDWLLWN